MAGLYIHVPFCVTRCVYCDFYSNTQIHHKEAYLSALVKEMEMRQNYLAGETLNTVYWGGGTPSILKAVDWEQVFEAIYRLFPVNEKAEITLEANPDDLTPEYISTLRRLPFNRISIGVQSFNDADLRFLGRRHSGKQAATAVRLCKESGYENISIDLMYGLPGQTPAQWEQNVEEALRLNLVHLSAYHLIYEEGTRLYRMKEEGRIQAVDEETSLSLFTVLIDRLTDAGYQHYEISNFAQPNYLSLHNTSYWTGEKYLGVGPSAHSYNIESRQWNVSSLSHYLQSIRSGASCAEIEALNIHNKYNEYILTSLRTQWGIHLPHILTKFGEGKYNYCIMQARPYINTGILQVNGDRLLLSRRGLFISDTIMSDLLWVDSYTK
jgi:oxygen-independent coproporphyrinogen-3 oxidase